MLSIHVFIISWRDQHESAIAIAKSIDGTADRISIVYSDPNPDLTLEVDCQQIRRRNDGFWGDKFKACLDACDSDLMLVIHADCDCEDWPSLVRKCRATMSKNPIIGVWAPLVDYTQFNLRRAGLLEIRSTSLTVVAQTDAIVFCLPKRILSRLKQTNYEGNNYGWGIDAMAIACAYASGMIAVVDRSLPVRHPRSRGYPTQAALAQCAEFYKQFQLAEVIQDKLLRSFIEAQDVRNADTGR